MSDAALDRQRALVEAFLAAARAGDFDALLAVLDPDVVVRADRGEAGSVLLRGAYQVTERAPMFSQFARSARAVLVNGAAGIVAFDALRRPFSVMGFIVARDRIIEIDMSHSEGLSRLTAGHERPT